MGVQGDSNEIEPPQTSVPPIRCHGPWARNTPAHNSRLQERPGARINARHQLSV